MAKRRHGIPCWQRQNLVFPGVVPPYQDIQENDIYLAIKEARNNHIKDALQGISIN
jgi:hypothetical protein